LQGNLKIINVADYEQNGNFPVVVLIGLNPSDVTHGEEYTELGAIAFDD